MISSNRGFTLPEVIMGTALAGLVMLGLAVVYLLGVDAWDKTSGRIILQRTASTAIYRISRDIQRADSLEITDEGSGLFCRIPDFESDSVSRVVNYRITDGKLLTEESGETVSLIPFSESDSISLEITEGEQVFSYSTDIPTTGSERIVKISFTISRDVNDIKEMLPFTTIVGARNL